MSIKTFGDYKYKVTDNKEITILKYMGEAEEVTIPDSIENKPVTEISCALIGDAGFCNSERVKTVMIPEGVRKIEMMSFAYSKSLERVYISAGVMEINSSAFSGSRSLTSITVNEGNKCFADTDGVLFNKEKSQLIFFPIGKSYNKPDGDRIPDGYIETLDYKIPYGVTSIAYSAFEDCCLRGVSIPNTVTEIGDRAFDGCCYLEKITLPEGLKTIEWGAFDSCVSLESVFIPESVTKVYQGAFKNCSSLKNIELPVGLVEVSSDAFAGCAALESMSIPNGVKGIERGTFKGCKALTSIFMPASVTYIDLSALEGCESLENIAIEESNPAYSFIDGVLRDKKNNKRLYTSRAVLLRNADVITNVNELAGKSDKEILGLISEALGIDYEIKSEIWEYGFCGDGPRFEVAFENENVVQLGSTKMTVKTLELCAALQSLEVLNICYSDVDVFPESLCSLSKLRLLNLHGTKITVLPNGIGQLAALEELQFGGTKIPELPDTVCCLSRLTKLRAQHSGLERLPQDIGKLKNLETLDIHYSRVNELPESLADCKRLDSLWWKFNENDPQIPEAVVANIMANFGTTSEMSSFARFRNHSHNKEFVIQIVMAGHKLVQIWKNFEQLIEIDENFVLGFSGAYVYTYDDGARYLFDMHGAISGSRPLDDEALSPALLGSSIFRSKYLSGCSEITKEEMESWIPLMHEFYSMDENYKKDYPAFYKRFNEDLDRIFKS